MHDDQDTGHDEHDHEHEHEDSLELELTTQSQIFLEMRQQNLELLRIASQVAGYAGNHGPLKPNDFRQAVKAIWEIYAEFYSWVDPEESNDDDEEDEEE